MKNEGNLVVLNTNNNNLNQNLEKSNNRYSILKRPSNASGNKYNAMSYDFNLKNDLNNNNLDLLKDIQELMEHGDLNLYQILSDYKSKEKMDTFYAEREKKIKEEHIKKLKKEEYVNQCIRKFRIANSATTLTNSILHKLPI